jgi:hypothetical protein
VTPPSGDDPLELARRAVDLAGSDPAAATEAASRAIELAAGRDPVAEATAERALGMVAMYAHELDAAGERLRSAIARAEAHGAPQLAGEVRTNLAAVLAMQGENQAGLWECERAAAVLTGTPRARLEVVRAALLEFEGRVDDALAGYGRALRALRAGGDRQWEMRALHNRGTLYLAQGDLRRARADLAAADEVMAELGLDRFRVQALEHLGRVEALSGDLPSALGRFAEADELMAGLGMTDSLGLIDRSAVLLAARLGEEAKAAAAGAVAESERAGDEVYLPEARLALAESCLLTGEPAEAAAQAELAGRSFQARRARRWAALADYVAARARWEAGERTSTLLRAARAVATRLERATGSDAGAEARLLAGSIALDLGRRAAARRELELAGRVSGAQPALVRVRAWHATALRRLVDGDRRGVRAAVRAGLRLVDAHRATLGATELRARAAGHGSELAAIGLRLAVDDGDAAGVLAWSERWRAGSLQPAGPPLRDPAVVRDLVELRQVSSEIESAALEGRDVEAARRRQVALETAVTRRLRTARGAASVSAGPPPAATIAAALDGAALLELSEVDGHVYGVLVAGRPTLAELGAAPEVRDELDAARFAVRRMAFGRGSTMALEAARAALETSAGRLDDLLLGPVRSRLGDRPLVVVPTAALHVVPWSALPSLRGRAVTVAPSAALWLRARHAPAHASGRVALVAGPRLTGAGPEVAGLARRYPDAVRLTGRRATVDAARAALDGARLAHVAAHGRFRADNPMFSTIELADGPLTVHDLEGLGRAPATLVLSACDSGLSAVHAGDELLGLAAGLLGLGTRTLVASLLPVPDDATRSLMLAFHRHLQSGAPAAEALARAQVGADRSGDHGAVAAAASFVCLGAS